MTVSGTSISIVDAAGGTPAAPIVSVSPNQIVFLVPASAAPGTAQVIVTNGTSTQTANNVQISTVAPAVLTLNGSGLAAANVVQVAPGGTQSLQQVSMTNSSGAIVANPIAVGAGGGTYLVLFGTAGLWPHPRMRAARSRCPRLQPSPESGRSPDPGRNPRPPSPRKSPSREVR